MKKLDAMQAVSAYIMLIGIACAALRLNIWIILIVFMIGFVWALRLSGMKKYALKYLIFLFVPIVALCIRLPIPAFLPDLIRLALTFFFWILILLLSSYLVLGHKKSKERHSSI